MSLNLLAMKSTSEKQQPHNQTRTSDFVGDVREIIESARREVSVSVNRAMIKAYWEIGRRIVEEDQNGEIRATYGSKLLRELSQKLTFELGKGYSVRSLADYRRFYLDYPHWEILHPRVQNLTWSHIRLLLWVSDLTARNWYWNETVNEMWSKRTLDRNIGTQYCYRLLASPVKEPVKEEMLAKTSDREFDNESPSAYIKSPVVTEFLGIPKDTQYTESHLESALISHLQQFMMELGKGFAFVERQQHIITETKDFYIDLVFYNYLMKCFVLFDLKTGTLTHQDIGQMDMYVRMYDDLKRVKGDNPTIGILLCTKTDETIAKYSVLNGSKQLFASTYMTYLPSEEELRREIERQKEIFYLQRKEAEDEE